MRIIDGVQWYTVPRGREVTMQAIVGGTLRRSPSFSFCGRFYMIIKGSKVGIWEVCWKVCAKTQTSKAMCIMNSYFSVENQKFKQPPLPMLLRVHVHLGCQVRFQRLRTWAYQLSSIQPRPVSNCHRNDLSPRKRHGLEEGNYFGLAD